MHTFVNSVLPAERLDRAADDCPLCAVISSPSPEQSGDLRVCVVDMSSTSSKVSGVKLEGAAMKVNGLAVRRRHTPDNASTTHQTPPSTTSWTPQQGLQIRAGSGHSITPAP